MKKRLIMFVLCAALLPAGPALTQHLMSTEGGLRGIGLTVKVPAEWSGIWSFTDSIFTCVPVLKSTSTGFDTLCAGTSFLGQTIGFVCTGTATATTIDLTCTWNRDVFPDCQASTVITIKGSVTGDTYNSVTTTNTTFSGTGTGCDLLQPICSIVHEHATRTGPAPAAYCATAVLPTSWGKIKAIYR